MLKNTRKALSFMLVLALLMAVVPMSLPTKVNAWDASKCALELQNGQVAVYAYIEGATDVRFPTWTLYNDQDDIVWYDGWQGNWTIDGHNYNWATVVPMSDHNYESGAYATHIYYNGLTFHQAMDYELNTNPSVVRCTYVQDGTSGYTVYAYVVDNGLYPITKVQCPTWTTYNGQDDLASDWQNNSSVTATYGDYIINGEYYNESFYVSFAAHNGETGEYTTHVYAFNGIDHNASSGIQMTPNFASPTVDRVKLVQDGAAGYYAYAYVSTNGGLDINRVQFPSWTSYNGQDDLPDPWQTNSACTGTAGNWTVDGQTYNYRKYVAVADHNNEYGLYETDVYAFNNANLSGSYCGQTFEFNFNLTIDDGDGTYNGESSMSGKYGDTKNITNPTAPEGYHFKQWNLSGSGTFDKSSAVFVFGAGDGTLTAEYEAHSYTTYVSQDTAPTCTSNEFAVYECSCGATAVLEVPDTKLDHKFNVLQSDENGHWYKCEDCDAKTTSTAHEYNETAFESVASTCKTAGYDKYKCKTCDDVKTVVRALDYTNHEGDTEVKDDKVATCTEKGYTGDTYCKSCNNKISTGEDIEMKAHTFTAETVDEKYFVSDATCTALAVYKKSCSACGLASETETFTTGEMKAHDFTAETVDEKYFVSSATCTAKAVYKKSCSVCGLASETETFTTISYHFIKAIFGAVGQNDLADNVPDIIDSSEDNPF